MLVKDANIDQLREAISIEDISMLNEAEFYKHLITMGKRLVDGEEAI